MFPKYSNRNQYYVKDKYRAYGLEIGASMSHLFQEEILSYWNGIGADGSWYNFLIPKTIWWLNYELCSADHDVGYEFACNEKQRLLVDLRFKRNLIKWVRIHTSKKNRWLLKARLLGVRAIYLSVRQCGEV